MLVSCLDCCAVGCNYVSGQHLDWVQVSSSIRYACFSGGAGAVGDAGDVESAPPVSGGAAACAPLAGKALPTRYDSQS